METYATSFLHLLRDIYEATSRRKESETNYDNLLRKIFMEGDIQDAAAYAEIDVEHVPVLKVDNVFGRENEMGKLLVKCCNPNEKEKGIQLSAIPIVGAAGIGKTTLARLIYEHRLVQEHFEMRVWVKVDGLEFNLHHAAQQILESILHMTCSIDGLNELDEMVRGTLLGGRCLIVFDGVESMAKDVWFHMSKNWFYFVDVGSVVLITTPSKSVADLVSSEAFELRQLIPDDGFSLAFDSSDIVKELLTLINITALCGCVPLLLKLLGNTTRLNDKLRNLLSSLPVSDAIFRSTFDARVPILLCIWALPLHIRQCLALCAVFPKGYALNREKVISMWVAHGLVKPSPKNNLRGIGDSYFHQLLCRSFFTDISRNEFGDITEFRMPSLIHTTMQDITCIVLNGKLGVSGSIIEEADQLSLHSKYAGGDVPEDIRTLIFSCTLYSGDSSLDHSFLDFHELQSLDLSCSGIRNLSGDICALKELRYLNLSYTLIETLPDSITDLSRLQTLDLSYCYHYKVLPKKLRNLSSMTHLDLSQCESLCYSPSGIGFLVSLTSMPLFVLGKDHDSARLGELGLLNQLRNRLDIKNLENVMEISEARNAKLNQKNLRHLGLYWSKDVGDCFEILELLEPNGRLSVLDVTGYMGTRFPRWISSMSSLIKISITDCGCEELPSLGQLHLLKELLLKGMANIQYIGPQFYGNGVIDAFPSLEQLGLYDMPTLLRWSGADNGFRRLKTLTIEGCPQLQSIPTLRNLGELIVCSSSDEIFSCLDLSRFDSLCSLLIKNMGFGTFFKSSSRWPSLKKLILYNCWTKTSVEIEEHIELQHLGILNCPQLRYIILHHTISIQKLHVANCPDLESINFNQESSELTQLVVEGCPELLLLIVHNLPWLSKLIISNSDKFIPAGYLKMLKKLQYLSIIECPLLERKLEMEPSLISHIPCVLLSNHKVEYRISHDSQEYQDSEEDTMSAIFESEHESRQESTLKGSSSPGSTIFELPPIRSTSKLKRPMSTNQQDSRQFHLPD